jgi:hypothetical protein
MAMTPIAKSAKAKIVMNRLLKRYDWDLKVSPWSCAGNDNISIFGAINTVTNERIYRESSLKNVPVSHEKSRITNKNGFFLTTRPSGQPHLKIITRAVLVA